ncbi:FimD/PapC C-terminal domain-containing protein [Klebsiella michiganensis]
MTSDGSQASSIIADNGQVYLSGMPLMGKVRAKWGEGPNASCEADYSLPPEKQNQMLIPLSAECR